MRRRNYEELLSNDHVHHRIVYLNTATFVDLPPSSLLPRIAGFVSV